MKMRKKEMNKGEEEKRWPQNLCLSYVKGLLESTERECKVIGSEKLKLHPNRTMSQALV